MMGKRRIARKSRKIDARAILIRSNAQRLFPIVISNSRYIQEKRLETQSDKKKPKNILKNQQISHKNFKVKEKILKCEK